MSWKNQYRRGYAVHLVGSWERWQDALATGRSAPVPALVACRIDFGRWLASRPAREQEVARLLLEGWNAHQIAQRLKINPCIINAMQQRWRRSIRLYLG